MTDSPALIAATEALAAEPGIGRTRAARLYAMKSLDAAGPHIRADERARTDAELESLREQREALLAENAYLSEQLDLSRAMGSRLAEIPERSTP